MTENPSLSTPEADVPLGDLGPILDERLRAVAEDAQRLTSSLLAHTPDNPARQLALRYVDLAVQAARDSLQGGQEGPRDGRMD